MACIVPLIGVKCVKIIVFSIVKVRRSLYCDAAKVTLGGRGPIGQRDLCSRSPGSALCLDERGCRFGIERRKTAGSGGGIDALRSVVEPWAWNRGSDSMGDHHCFDDESYKENNHA